MALTGKEIVEKSNRLNEVVLHGATLQEKRFFCIYLAKINARNPETRKVRFALSDFQRLMELGRMNIRHFQTVTNNLLCKVYNQPNEDGGYTGFTIFKRCRVFRDKTIGEWFVEIEASDDALPLMFNLKNKYFKYALWNTLRCKSANQVTMYELLKQHEKQGSFEISVDHLREILDLKKEHERWDNFRKRILEACQKALEENTDIKFTFRKGKSGGGRAWKTIIFDIYHNDNYIDQIFLQEFFPTEEVDTLLPSEDEANYEYLEEDLTATPEPDEELNEREDREALDSKQFFEDDEEDIQEMETANWDMERADICFGFEDPIFRQFTREQLIELRDLAVPNVPTSLLDRHKEVLPANLAAQFAASEYIKTKINFVRAKPAVKNFYSYLRLSVWKDYN